MRNKDTGTQICRRRLNNNARLKGCDVESNTDQISKMKEQTTTINNKTVSVDIDSSLA